MDLSTPMDELLSQDETGEREGGGEEKAQENDENWSQASSDVGGSFCAGAALWHESGDDLQRIEPLASSAASTPTAGATAASAGAAAAADTAQPAAVISHAPPPLTSIPPLTVDVGDEDELHARPAARAESSLDSVDGGAPAEEPTDSEPAASVAAPTSPAPESPQLATTPIFDMDFKALLQADGSSEGEGTGTPATPTAPRIPAAPPAIVDPAWRSNFGASLLDASTPEPKTPEIGGLVGAFGQTGLPTPTSSCGERAAELDWDHLSSRLDEVQIERLSSLSLGLDDLVHGLASMADQLESDALGSRPAGMCTLLGARGGLLCAPHFSHRDVHALHCRAAGVAECFSMTDPVLIVDMDASESRDRRLATEQGARICPANTLQPVCADAARAHPSVRTLALTWQSCCAPSWPTRSCSSSCTARRSVRSSQRWEATHPSCPRAVRRWCPRGTIRASPSSSLRPSCSSSRPRLVACSCSREFVIMGQDHRCNPWRTRMCAVWTTASPHTEWKRICAQ